MTVIWNWNSEAIVNSVHCTQLSNADFQRHSFKSRINSNCEIFIFFPEWRKNNSFYLNLQAIRNH